jgi:microcystin-dependent protein
MAKTKISEFDVDPSNNTDINSINIAEGCAPSGINNAIRQLMSDLKEWQNGSSGDSMTVAGTLTASGTLNVTGNLQLDGAAGTAGQVMLSAGSGSTPTWGSGFPTGGIIIWSGASNAIPSGWLLCDGSNSTPDLRNRFVVGAGSTYAVGATGGSADAIVVSHTHTATVTDPGHTHAPGSGDTFVTRDTASPQLILAGSNTDFRADLPATTASATTNISVTNASTGSSGTNANLPPYYALCYIMKS